MMLRKRWMEERKEVKKNYPEIPNISTALSETKDLVKGYEVG